MRRHILATLTIALVLVTGIVSWRIIIPDATLQEAPTPGVAREDFTINFGGVTARAQLTYPEAATVPLPLVILVAGSGPADMDATLVGPDGERTSRLFRVISDYLTLCGYATVRYNKRHVESATDHPGEAEYALYATPSQLQADLDSVYTTISTHPRIDRSRIILYGWSEGALIVTGVALDHPEIAGVILQAPFAGTYRDVGQFQQLGLGVPFLREHADADRDGLLSKEEISAAWRQDVGVSLQPLRATLTESFWGRTRVRRELDTNRDGLLDIATEIRDPLIANFARWDDQFVQAGLGVYATTGQPLPVSQRLPGYAGPILLLHGENDGSVPVSDTHQIGATLVSAGHRDHTTRLYPGLGHTLGPARDRYRDLYAPIAPDVLMEIADWLDQRYRR